MGRFQWNNLFLKVWDEHLENETSCISVSEIFPLKIDIFPVVLNDFCADCYHSIVSLPQAEIRLLTCAEELEYCHGRLTLFCSMPCSWGALNKLYLMI